METKLINQPFEQVQADALVLVVYEDQAAPTEIGQLSAWLEEMKSSGEFSNQVLTPSSLGIRYHVPSISTAL